MKEQMKLEETRIGNCKFKNETLYMEQEETRINESKRSFKIETLCMKQEET